MKTKRHPFRTLCLVAGVFLPLVSSQGASLYTYGHGDIRVGAVGGQLSLQYYIGAPESDYAIVGGEFVFGESFAASDIWVNVPVQLTTTLPGEFPLLAGSAGESVWVIPTNDPYPIVAPFLGFSTEGFDGSLWGGFQFTLGEVRSPSGSGEFAVWTGLDGGGINPLLSTVEGVSQDSFTLTGNGHVHHFMGFTEAGLWEVDFTVASTYLPDGTLGSATETYYFHVVPEPTSFCLAAAGLAAVLLRRSRCRA
ncbi:choice-of-anchor M domain-containing protein [Luteolibacter sp. SL250]|uniref:choice-of-anchor M domain-containing protein n=1 Tax=Luteolibacter sp. SL250 TaxID=2995170 RepID=UPI00226FD2D9|nr:choice-of-anchor M domain-containing protein [Luteolibacter sp. SL250]WAC21240.1 choice-of-anchor M domain-containing protein [Luteolibacter sp. SL250]